MSKKNTTKNNILNIAESMFSKEGYVAVSINQIAKAVNIAKSSVYHFFGNKQDLYFQVLLRAFEKIDLLLKTELKKKGEIDQKIHNLIVTYLDFGFKNEEIFYSIIQKASTSEKKVVNFIAKLRKKIVNHFENIIQKGIDNKIFPATDPKLLAYLLVGAMDAFLTDTTIIKEKRWSSKEVAEQIVKAFFDNQKKNLK